MNRCLADTKWMPYCVVSTIIGPSSSIEGRSHPGTLLSQPPVLIHKKPPISAYTLDPLHGTGPDSHHAATHYFLSHVAATLLLLRIISISSLERPWRVQSDIFSLGIVFSKHQVDAVVLSSKRFPQAQERIPVSVPYFLNLQYYDTESLPTGRSLPIQLTLTMDASRSTGLDNSHLTHASPYYFLAHVAAILLIVYFVWRDLGGLKLTFSLWVVFSKHQVGVVLRFRVFRKNRKAFSFR